MPIAETPLEHAGDAALAMKWTGEPTVAPLLGLFTVTPARAGSASAHMQTSSFPSFIERSPAFPIGCESSSEVERILGRQLLTLNKKDCRNQSEVHVRGKAKPLANPRSNSWRWLHRWREVRDPHGIQLIGQRPKYQAFCRAGARFCGFFLAVLRRCGRFQRAQQPRSGGRYFLNSGFKYRFIRLRRLRKSANLSDEL